MGLCALFLSLGLILALSYSLVINKFLSIAGSVFFTLIGNLKFIFIIILSYYIFHDELTITNVIGVFITFIGFMLYSYFKDADENKNDNLENSEQKFQNGILKEKTIQYDDVYSNNEENEFLLTTNDHVRYSNKFETEVIDDVDNGNSNNNNKTLQWVFYVETFLSIFVLIMLFSFLFLGHNNNKQQGALLLLNNNNSNFNNKKNVSISNVWVVNNKTNDDHHHTPSHYQKRKK